MSGRKVIVCVDDEALVVMAIKLELKHKFPNDICIETAITTQEALVLIKEIIAERDELKILLSDWLMPGLSGSDFIDKVREIVPNVPAIIMTGHAENDEIVSLIQSKGPVYVLTKPWQSNALIRQIQKYL